MHRGDRRLLAALATAPAAERLVLIAAGDPALPRLASLRQRIDSFRAGAVDVVVRLGGEDVSDRAGLRRLKIERLLVSAGDAVPEAVLASAAGVDHVEEAVVHGLVVTAARVRAAVAAGEMAAVAAMIGAPYAVDGRVVHGFHRGATIGVPTANLRVRGVALPPDGVYAVTARALPRRGGEQRAVGVANLGRKPTFGDEDRALETHIFDFAGDLYGARLEVGFVERLRDERKFAGVDELVEQIRRDIAAARAVHERSR